MLYQNVSEVIPMVENVKNLNLVGINFEHAQNLREIFKMSHNMGRCLKVEHSIIMRNGLFLAIEQRQHDNKTCVPVGTRVLWWMKINCSNHEHFRHCNRKATIVFSIQNDLARFYVVSACYFVSMLFIRELARTASTLFKYWWHKAGTTPMRRCFVN